MTLKPLFPQRDPRLPSDTLMDAMLREVLGQPQPNLIIQQPEESARDFALRHGWPVPTKEQREGLLNWQED